MRIDSWIRTFVALLVLTAVFCQVRTSDFEEEEREKKESSEFHKNYTLLYGDRVKRSPKKNFRHRNHQSQIIDHLELGILPYSHEHVFLYEPGRQLAPRDNQRLLKDEWRNGAGSECCPSVKDMIEPEGGRNERGEYVELYKDDTYRQRFHELLCHKSVLDKPCRFMDKKVHMKSKCVQVYSYTYALVKDTPDHRSKKLPTFPGQGSSNTSYTLDYIRIGSGCTCVVQPNIPPKTKRRRKPLKEHAHKRKHELDERDIDMEYDDTADEDRR